MKNLENLLTKANSANILPWDLNQEKIIFFDFTADNPELKNIDVADPDSFTKYIFTKLSNAGARIGIGRYNENRTIYDKSPVFAALEDHSQRRTLHIGLDLWVAAGTPVLAPLDGVVHSFQDNNAFGDYGPTIILEHSLEKRTFFTLYGHLSRKSLEILSKGQAITAGQQIAAVGERHENGSWPPHLHFEIIKDLEGRAGDFPGVCTLKDRDKFLEHCPDPNLLLKIKGLKRPEP
ncbi:peptidoglycan DD-metalloendopeptidase family protein [Desulfonatronovibrio hydrogenovorans]|uniref:peptidoglycan DD-metalloendopeptidase family protein n=1 Tax=Desulfonatronovibrio hydrogenovorans TaxID=53245 RepID=UPI0006895601|nr:peptidoglycan DD-metalloendopeptidase family protein [Desulfonatronovibrio hydrogenovorans]